MGMPTSFSSFTAYLQALAETPTRLRRRACAVTTSFEETSRLRARSGPEMKRTLRWYDLVGFGIGGMVGAGVFVTTGRASRLCAGSAVVLSYAIAGICALLSAFCYTEFAVDMPVSGGAFSYIRVTFGEFLAFLTASNLIVDYVLSNAAVARGFTAYLGTALGFSSDIRLRFTVPCLPSGYNELDPIAVAVVLLLTLVICYSVRESSWLNMTLTGAHILLIAFIIVMGFWRGDMKNFVTPGDRNQAGGLLPFGVAGVLNGAAMVYLSFIGYDAVSTMAEEVKNPVKDIPVGVSGSVVVVTILYCLMAASMSALLPYDKIDPEAPFSGAFDHGSAAWRWVSRVIGISASFGILTSLLVSMVGQSRYMCVIGRSCLVPSWFARVHQSTSTPINASVCLGICTAAIALFTDLNILLNLVTIGTLFVFYMVANAVIFRRYVVIGTTNPWPTLWFLISFSFISLTFILLWHFAPSGPAKGCLLITSSVVAIAIVQLFRSMVPQARKPEHWGVPFMPWIPFISIFLNMFLLGSLDRPSYLRFVCFSAVSVFVYVLYSVHSTFDAEANGNLNHNHERSIHDSRQRILSI